VSADQKHAVNTTKPKLSHQLSFLYQHHLC